MEYVVRAMRATSGAGAESAIMASIIASPVSASMMYSNPLVLETAKLKLKITTPSKIFPKILVGVGHCFAWQRYSSLLEISNEIITGVGG